VNHRASLLAQIAATRSQLDALEALVQSAPDEADELLDTRQARDEFGIGHDGLLAAHGRGELELVRGARRKLLVRRSALMAWIQSRQVEARPRRKQNPASTLDDWDADAGAELRLLAGGRR
jgi:hypothetical protein